MNPEKHSAKKNIYKLIYQFGILFILAYMGVRLYFDKVYTPDFEAYCPFGGIQALGSYLTLGSLACTMTGTQIIMGIILALGAMLFGKLFCGFMCPVGTVSELLGKLGEKMRIMISLKGIPDQILRVLKYVLLFVTFYFTLDSSELFCKKYDPYFVLASGFNSDVFVLYAIIALALLLIGSLFIRLAWCKYFCPLGALSNIFRFWWFFLTFLGIYLTLLFAGLQISYVWPLAVVSAGGYILEVWKKKKVTLSPFTITRSEESCINCNICTKKCPQGIDVALMNKVTHIDCNMCGDCVTHCPEKDTLQVNRKNMNWLPAAVLTALIILGFSLKSVWEIPTIAEKWGTKEELAKAAVFTKDGLKNIKCFGSSSAFSAQMRNVSGVYGVATYVAKNGVKVWYNPEILNDTMIQEIIFTPVKEVFKELNQTEGKILKITIGIDYFFDPMDAFYLTQLLTKYTSAVSMQSSFSCPVLVSLYFPADSAIEIPALINIIEMKSLSYSANEIEYNIALKYKVISTLPNDTLDMDTYRKEMYLPVQVKFENYTNYSTEEISIFKLPMGGNTKVEAELNYLISHISADDGIIAFNTSLDENGIEWAEIEYIDSLTQKSIIMEELNEDSLHYILRNGSDGTKVNPFHFEEFQDIN